MVVRKVVGDIEYELTAQIYEMFPEDRLLPKCDFSSANVLIMEKGAQCREFGVEDVASLFAKTSSTLYAIPSKTFSPSLYSFFSPSAFAHDVEYRRCLVRLVQDLSRKHAALRACEECMLDRANAATTEFTLLHGDLHIGNVVEIDGELLLIDWEYCCTGSPNLEFAYFAVHYAMHKKFTAAELESVCRKILNRKYHFGFSVGEILGLYIPLVSALFYDALFEKRLANDRFKADALEANIQYFACKRA